MCFRRLVRPLCMLLLSVSLQAAEPVAASEVDAASQVKALIRESRGARSAMDFSKALDALDRAQSAAGERADLRARIEIERAAVLGRSGAAGRALRASEAAVELLAGSQDLRLRGKAHRRLAEVLNLQSKHAEAEIALAEAARLFELAGAAGDRASLESTRSILAVHRGAYESALEHGARALELLEKEGARAATVTPLSNIAYSLHQLGRWAEAEEAYERVIDVAWQAGDQYVLEFAYCNRAETRRHRGETQPAIEDLERAIRGFEKARRTVLGSAEERARFLERQVSAYERLILYLSDSGRSQEAFEIAERFHGRSFLELLDPRTRLAAAQRRPELQSRERPVLDRMAEIHLRLSDSPPEREANGLAEELAGLELELWHREAEWQRQAPVESAWVAPRPPELSEIQSALAGDEALIVYWLAEHRIFIWTVTRDHFWASRAPLGRAEVESALEDYLAPLRSEVRARDIALGGAERSHLEEAAELYRWLIDPLPKELSGYDRWIIVPDGRLHHLPFESLAADCGEPEIDQEAEEALHGVYAGCRFLGLEKAISYSPSAGALMALRKRRARLETAVPGKTEGRSLLALAPTFEGEDTPAARRGLGALKWNGEEIRRIGKWFESPRILLGDSATESLLKRESGRYRLMHLATHGLVNDRFPLGSGVLLGADDRDDGLLQVSEVVGLDLRADLVTLSACRSGRGRLGRGEGIVGLGQAFLFAGASSLVLSLWDVDDRSTAQLMETFYRRLSEGDPAAEALLEARRSLFRESEIRRSMFRERRVSFAHPRFWSAFVLIGDG